MELLNFSTSGLVYFSASPKIVGFGQSADEAGRYAYALHNYKLSAQATRITKPTDTYAISSYEPVAGGWMIHHKDATKKNDFVSYVVSTVNDWYQFKTTLDTTLAYFMRGYTAAFPTEPSKPVLPSSETIQKTVTAFTLAVHRDSLSRSSNLEKDIKDIENAWLAKHMPKQTSQYVLPVRPSETEGLIGLPRIASSYGKTSEEQEQEFYQILRQSKKLQKLENGNWDGNNCMFAAIAHHPEVISEIVQFFGASEQLSFKDVQFQVRDANEKYTVGGKTLRRIVCQWILDKMDTILFPQVPPVTDKGAMPELTVRDVIGSIGSAQDNFDPVKYIIQLRDGCNTLHGHFYDFINEEISVIISVLIKRPIVVLTETEEGVLASKMAESFLSRMTWSHPPIYLHNNSRANGARVYSGSHYSGLRLIS